MNDLPWVKYEAQRMFLDLLGMSPWGKIAHVALFNYTLINDGPPANDNDSLRDITGCPPAEWGRTKRELLGKGWIETPKYFLHRGTNKTLNEAKETFVGNQNRSLAANKSKSRYELLPADPESGVVAYKLVEIAVKETVTATVTETVTVAHQQEQEQRQVRKEKSPFSIPSLEEVLVHADRIGVTPDAARQWFADRTAEGWCDRHGVDIGNWKVWLTGFRDRLRTMPTGISPTTEAILREKELTEIEARIKTLTSGDSHADLTDEERAKLRKWQARRKELKTALGWKL